MSLMLESSQGKAPSVIARVGIRIERRERNDHDDRENCELRPKARDGDRAGCCEQCDGRGDDEQACLEVSRDWHPLLYHFRESEVVPQLTYRARREAQAYFLKGLCGA